MRCFTESELSCLASSQELTFWQYKRIYTAKKRIDKKRLTSYLNKPAYCP